MIPQHIYDAIIESPAGKLINRLIEEDANARGVWDSTPGAHGSIIDQLYETITTAQKKHRRDRVKASNQDRLAKYQSFSQDKPKMVEWDAAHDYTSWKPTGESDDK